MSGQDDRVFGGGCERHRGDPHNLCPECWKVEPEASGPGPRAQEGQPATATDEADVIRAALMRSASDIEFREGRQEWVDEALAALGCLEARLQEESAQKWSARERLQSAESRALRAEDRVDELDEFATKLSSRALAAEARLADAQEALRRIAGDDPNGLDGIHWAGDEKNPKECPGCIAREALSGWSSDGTGKDQDLGGGTAASSAGGS